MSTSRRKELEKTNEKIQFEKARCMNEIDKLKIEKSGLTEIIKQKEKEISQATEKLESMKQDYLNDRIKLKQQLQSTENELT